MSLFSKSKPIISVCIPVYGTEEILINCLNSISAQKIPDGVKDFIEIVVVDDCSPVRDSASSAKKIVKSFAKTCPFSVEFIQHEYNKGLVEARRTAVYASKGQFIFILDSDDTIHEDALKVLYEKAVSSGADIVHGKATVTLAQSNSLKISDNEEILKRYMADREQQVNKVYNGELLNLPEKNEILNGYLLEKNHMGYLWGKLYRREVYIRAFEHIPPIQNTMCEDLIQYVWLCYEAKKYVSVDNIVYNYSINTGLSSRSIISDLKRWEMVCSTASVFTALYTEFENPLIHFTEDQKDVIRKNCISHLRNNLEQLEQAVAPELKPEAYNMLCDYWGEDFVVRIKSEMEKAKQSS